jgi:elongation factor Ts
MQITASMVKELRERTGAGMMDCKKALQETEGDIDAAIENMRKAGIAKAAKKAGRTAAEGVIVIRTDEAGAGTAMAEVNCETDFVAKDENFTRFADGVAATILASGVEDVEALQAQPMAGMDGVTVEEARQQLVAKIGENTSVRRFVRFQPAGSLGSYLHGVRIGVLVDVDGGDADLPRDLAMHIAASRPVCVDESGVPQEMLDKEREIFAAQAAESGKPPEIVEKMVAGRLQKYLKEITLTGQPFVKDPDKTVGQLLKEKGAKVNAFVRYEVGEGIEKKSDSFAEEVMAQAKGG